MKTATIRQIRNDFPRVLAWVQAGEEVTVLNRTRPVARLCPPRAQALIAFKAPDFTARARRIFGNSKPMSNIILEEREQSEW